LLSNLLHALIEQDYSARIAGNLNVTSGDVGVGTALFAKCACLGVSATRIDYSCGDCGRGVGNYLWVQSGDGAGSYPVIEILSNSQELVGAFVVFDSPLASSPTIQNQIATGQLSTFDFFGLAKLKAFGDLRALRLGELADFKDILVADAQQFHDKNNHFTSFAIKDAPVTAIAFCEPISKTDLVRKDNDLISDAPESPRPRLLAVLSSSLAKQATLTDAYVIEDWSSQILTWRTSMITTEITSSNQVESEPIETGSEEASKFSHKETFCTQCGTQLLKPAQKFCQTCGTLGR